MKEGSSFRIVLGVVLVVALIAAAAALGWMAYNAGVTQGAAQGAGAPLAVAPYAMYGPHFMAPFGFGFLGCLAPLAFLFLVFGLFRLVVWGGMGRHMHGGWGRAAGAGRRARPTGCGHTGASGWKSCTGRCTPPGAVNRRPTSRPPDPG